MKFFNEKNYIIIIIIIIIIILSSIWPFGLSILSSCVWAEEVPGTISSQFVHLEARPTPRRVSFRVSSWSPWWWPILTSFAIWLTIVFKILGLSLKNYNFSKCFSIWGVFDWNSFLYILTQFFVGECAWILYIHFLIPLPFSCLGLDLQVSPKLESQHSHSSTHNLNFFFFW